MGHLRGSKRSPKKIGTAFENTFSEMARIRGWSCTKLPDGCVQRGPMLVRVETPFDFILTKEGRAIFLDCKSSAGSTFSHSMIKEHQMSRLLEQEHQGFTAGYLVFFSKICRLVFFDASKLFNCRSGDSLKPEDGFSLGNLHEMDLNLLTKRVEQKT